MENLSIVLKWSGSEYSITDVTTHDTVAVLRHEIFKKTEVRPERQKFLNLKHKGKAVSDELKLGTLQLKPNFKLMMVGSRESDIEDACNKPDGIDDKVIDDFNDNGEKDSIAVENTAIYLAKIEKRIRDYKLTILNPPRGGKNLLVLDIDYTLFDHRSVAQTGVELMRPYLHEFLISVYNNYDIVIWSATSMKWIEEKMKLLGVNTHPQYKIMFYFDSSAMISVYIPEKGVVDCKPLGVIWGKYPSRYNSKNTVMLDDIRHNFLMNPKSGLRIRPFSKAHINRDKDIELIKLSKYLKDIAENCDDFNILNHREWEKRINSL